MPSPPRPQHSPGQARLWRWTKEILIVLVAALALSLLLKTFVVQSFFIPTPSMENTLETGDRILVTKWRPGLWELRRGDMVVFTDPGGWLTSATEPPTGLSGALNSVFTFVGLLPDGTDEHLVKRIIGLPGDTVTCERADAQVHVNGVALQEDYLAPGSRPCGTEYEVSVPDGYLWVLGDNRNFSADSRAHMGKPGGGTIPIANVVGTVFATVWPLDHATTHRNPDLG